MESSATPPVPMIGTPLTDVGSSLQELLAAYEQLANARRRGLQLSPTEEAALLLIGDGITAPTDLSKAIGFTTAGMTNMLDRLEADGLVRREPHATDKRRVLLTLTKKGYRAQLHLDAVNQVVASRANELGLAREINRFLLDAAALVRDFADNDDF